MQAGVELTRKTDAAKAVEIETWLSFDRDFVYGITHGLKVLSGMGEAIVGTVSAPDRSCNDCRHSARSWSARSHTERARLPVFAGNSLQPISVRALAPSKSRRPRGSLRGCTGTLHSRPCDI